MSLYHEAAAILSQDTSEGGSLKSRVFGRKGLKSPPTQLYALVSETCKWSAVLKEVIEATGILEKERKVSKSISFLLSFFFFFYTLHVFQASIYTRLLEEGNGSVTE